MGSVTAGERAQDTVDMAKIVFGDRIPDETFVMSLINASSPLTWDATMLDAAEIYAKVSYMSTFTVAWFVILAWSALYFGIKYHRVFQEVNERALRSAAMAHEAQLKMLRYQLNPHFLFNTLNNLYALTLDKSDQAQILVVGHHQNVGFVFLGILGRSGNPDVGYRS